MTLLTEVPDELFGRGIAPAQPGRGFGISLDTAEPWGGGRVAGRVESRGSHRDEHPITVAVSCLAAWLDVAPQAVGKKPLLRFETYWELRTRFPVWLDEEVWIERIDLGPLSSRNWLQFVVDVPDGLPRAFEGTFASFRFRVEATRGRVLGRDVASLPLLLSEPRTLPVVRVETTPIGTWRLLDLRAESERGGAAGPCSITFEERRPDL